MESFNKEELDYYLNLGIDRAKNSLNHFFELLEINPELFGHLFDIKIFIDYDKKIIDREDAVAIYETADNENDDLIALSCEHINELLLDFKDNYIRKQDLINEIATTIIHEILHRNRTIILDNNLKADDVSFHDKYEDLFKDYDIESFKKLLDDTISNGFYNYFDNIVPIKATLNENNNYDVVAYNKINDSFLIYNNQLFGLDSDKFVTLLRIGVELNSEAFNHNIAETIPYKNGPYENEYYAGSIAYYHQSHLKEEKTLRDIKFEKISYLEESLIETIAKLVIYSRKKETIDLDGFSNKICNDNNSLDNIKLASKMLKMMGKETIEWFILSSYGDEYDDKLQKIFNDKYELLLLYYERIMNSFHTNKLDIKAVENIMDEKIR